MLNGKYSMVVMGFVQRKVVTTITGANATIVKQVKYSIYCGLIMA